jgi:hypothetical protein
MVNCVVAAQLVRKLCLVAALAATAFLPGSDAQAQVKVNGYRRSNGTYVPSHYRSKPNGSFHDNWSTKGNRNPYTGEWGTRVTPPSGYGGGGYLPSSEYSGLRSDLPGGSSPGNTSAASPQWEMSVIRNSSSPLTDDPMDTTLPPNPRPATLRESIETGAVDGQVVENPFIRSPRKKTTPSAKKPTR